MLHWISSPFRLLITRRWFLCFPTDFFPTHIHPKSSRYGYTLSPPTVFCYPYNTLQFFHTLTTQELERAPPFYRVPMWKVFFDNIGPSSCSRTVVGLPTRPRLLVVFVLAAAFYFPLPWFLPTKIFILGIRLLLLFVRTVRWWKKPEQPVVFVVFYLEPSVKCDGILLTAVQSSSVEGAYSRYLADFTACVRRCRGCATSSSVFFYDPASGHRWVGNFPSFDEHY